MSVSEQPQAGEAEAPADIEKLMAVLHEEDREARINAMEMLVKVGDARAIQAVAAGLQDSDEAIRQAASVHLLMAAYNNPDAQARQLAGDVMRQWADQQPGKKSSSIGFSASPARKVGYFLLYVVFGLVFWAIPVLGFAIIPSIISSGTSELLGLVVIIVGIALLMIPVSFALKGWEWFRQYSSGTVGEAIKIFILVWIGATIIGLIPILYWTGKGGLEWLSEKGIVLL